MNLVSRYKYVLKNVSPLYISSFKEVTPRISYINNDSSYNRISRYNSYRIIIDNNVKKYYETMNNTKIEESDMDKFCEVTDEFDRLDKIAKIYYNDVSYWWIIAKSNNIIDPFNLENGTILRIPDINSVYSSEGVVNNV